MKEEAAIWERVDALHPWKDNPRKNKGAIGHVAESIKRFGFASPIIARAADKTIIAGHTRYEAAKQLGLEKIPVRYLDLDPADSRLLALADNKIGEIAEWDEDKLEKVMQELLDEGISLEDIGWSDDELGKIVDELKQEEIEEDELPEADEEGEPDSKLGEVYELGEHRLICGDSTLPETWEKLMQGEKADMVFTDPPYGMFLDTDYTAMQSKFASAKSHKYNKVIGDNDDFNPKLVTVFFDIFSYCKEIFLWGADYYAEHLIDKNKGSWFVWDKRIEDSMDKMYGSCFELCWSKKKHKRELCRVLWAGLFGMGQEEKRRVHPTQKPVKLVRWFFDRYGKERDIIVDGYGGSGSTLIAAAQTKRRARLVELDPKYCDVIRRRWTQYAKDHDLEIGTGGLE
jgi:DNA modification methylase